MTTRTTTLLASAAVALALGAAGCGASGTATTTTAAKDDPTVAKTGGDGGVLALGAGTVTPFVDYGTPNQNKPTKVGVRVHEVRKGRIADFKGFDLEPAQRRAIPYYIDATFENRGRFALSRNLLRASLEDSGGREYRPTTLVVLGGSFQRCPQGGRAPLNATARRRVKSCAAAEDFRPTTDRERRGRPCVQYGGNRFVPRFDGISR